jgi:hypothetical protein
MSPDAEHGSAVTRKGVLRALRLAAGHMNVSRNEKITEADLLACLRGECLEGSSRRIIGAFLADTDLVTICDLVVSGVVTYRHLAEAAAIHLPLIHPTREWLDDRATH